MLTWLHPYPTLTLPPPPEKKNIKRLSSAWHQSNQPANSHTLHQVNPPTRFTRNKPSNKSIIMQSKPTRPRTGCRRISCQLKRILFQHLFELKTSRWVIKTWTVIMILEISDRRQYQAIEITKAGNWTKKQKKKFWKCWRNWMQDAIKSSSTTIKTVRLDSRNFKVYARLAFRFYGGQWKG